MGCLSCLCLSLFIEERGDMRSVVAACSIYGLVVVVCFAASTGPGGSPWPHLGTNAPFTFAGGSLFLPNL